MDMELEGRPRQLLMLKEWLELESSAELSRDGFGCYPRHLAAELRSVSGRRRNGDFIVRVSAAVRAALFPLPGREGQAALSRSISRRLRVGFWKKRSREGEERDIRVASCSATVASERRDGSASPAMSPRRMSRDGRKTGGTGAGLGGHRSHETEVERCECKAACHLDEEREQEQRLSPVSVMDIPGQDDDDGNDGGGDNGRSEYDGDDEVTSSPTFERSLANVRRASQQLLQKIRQFGRLAELDTSDVDDATTIAEDTSCHIWDLDSAEGDEDAARESAQDLLSLPEARSPRAPHCFKKLLEDFFRDGLLSSCHHGNSDGPNVEKSLLETAKAWVDGRYCTAKPDGKAEVEEIEQLGRWRCFREGEQELLAIDVEDDIFWSLVGELVDDLC